jgi:hypothetical protein
MALAFAALHRAGDSATAAATTRAASRTSSRCRCPLPLLPPLLPLPLPLLQLQQLGAAECGSQGDAAGRTAGVNGAEHLAASGVKRTFVVVCRSHASCRHTSWKSAVTATSHSIHPAPMAMAAR